MLDAWCVHMRRAAAAAAAPSGVEDEHGGPHMQHGLVDVMLLPDE
jgi:hypothetical protein